VSRPVLLLCPSVIGGIRHMRTNIFFTWGALLIDEVIVTNNAESRSYDAFVDGELAGSIVYEHGGDLRVVFTHTFVEPRFRGRGIGNALVREALDDVRAKGLTLTNFCDFVARYIDAHPDDADLLDATHPGHVLGL
jgi:predicted GNAT family acetyltransferase